MGVYNFIVSWFVYCRPTKPIRYRIWINKIHYDLSGTPCTPCVNKPGFYPSLLNKNHEARWKWWSMSNPTHYGEWRSPKLRHSPNPSLKSRMWPLQSRRASPFSEAKAFKVCPPRTYVDQGMMTVFTGHVMYSFIFFPVPRKSWLFLVGGLEHFLFSHILGIIIPIDVHIFQRGGPTTNQFCCKLALSVAGLPKTSI